MSTLYEVSEYYRRAFLDLAEMEELDEQTLADTLESLDGELQAKAQNVLAYALSLEAEAGIIKAAEQRMSERRKAIEKRVEWMNSYLLRHMQACGITEIKANDGSFRARVMAGRESVVIDDQSILPKEFIRETVSIAPDKIALGRELKSGADIPGAHLERRPTLKID